MNPETISDATPIELVANLECFFMRLFLLITVFLSNFVSLKILFVLYAMHPSAPPPAAWRCGCADLRRSPDRTQQQPFLLEEVQPGVPFIVRNTEGKEVEILPIRVMHGKLPILGYRIGNMAWVTDMLTMPESEYPLLQGLDVLVMNALRPQPHGTHQSISEALENVKLVAPKETYFVHMSHHAGLHAEAEKELPPHVHFAYDGMVLTL